MSLCEREKLLCVVALSCPTLYDPMDWWHFGLQPVRLLCPWGFLKQEHWSGLTCPLPGNFLTTVGTWVSCTAGGLFTVCLPAPNKMGLDVYRRWVICLLLFPSTVYFASNIWVLFLFPWTLCRMEVLSKRKTLTQRELLSRIAVNILSSYQFIQNTRGWLFVFNYIYIRKNKWLASFCRVCCCCCC